MMPATKRCVDSSQVGWNQQLAGASRHRVCSLCAARGCASAAPPGPVSWGWDQLCSASACCAWKQPVALSRPGALWTHSGLLAGQPSLLLPCPSPAANHAARHPLYHITPCLPCHICGPLPPTCALFCPSQCCNSAPPLPSPHNTSLLTTPPPTHTHQPWCPPSCLPPGVAPDGGHTGLPGPPHPAAGQGLQACAQGSSTGGRWAGGRGCGGGWVGGRAGGRTHT